MTVRPPNFLSGLRPPETPQSALDHEIAQEKASTLGRLGRKLEETLGALHAFDAARREEADPQYDPSARRTLVAEAGTALWNFIVQREVLGLRDGARVLRDYQVPDEVRDRAGAFPAVPAPRRRTPRS